MNKYIVPIIAMLLLSSCASSPGEKEKITTGIDSAGHGTVSGDYFEKDNDSLVIPSFQVELNLSQQANEKLAAAKETIMVDALFTGDPKDTTTREFAEMGELFVGTKRIELSNSRIASFEGIKFSKARYDSLANKDIRVLINVFSGRRSTQDNLLDCAILADKMSAVTGKKFVLACKLIGEPDSLQAR